MEFKAVQKYVLISPKKLREISSLVKSLNPLDALEKVTFVKKSGTDTLKKVIQTAIANAKQKGINPKDLIFKEIQINEGPRLKRFRVGARGRIKPYKRRMSHIRVVLETKIESGELHKRRSRESRLSVVPGHSKQPKKGGRVQK